MKKKWQINGASCRCGLDVRYVTKDPTERLKPNTRQTLETKITVLVTVQLVGKPFKRLVKIPGTVFIEPQEVELDQ